MGWLEKLEGTTVGLDTAPIIYYIEQHPLYIEVLRSFFLRVDAGSILAVTSTVTLLEVLVHPLRRGDEALAQKYNDILLRYPAQFIKCRQSRGNFFGGATGSGIAGGIQRENCGRDPAGNSTQPRRNRVSNQ